MKPHRLFTSCGGVLIGLAVLYAGPAQAASGFTASELDAIREAVLRHQLKHNDSMQQGKTSAYFVSFGADQDPSEAFLRRFQGSVPPVRKRSAAVIWSNKDHKAGEGGQEPADLKGVWVRDKVTDEPGIILRVDRIRRLGRDRAEVTGGYYEGGLSASSNTYRVVRRRGKWLVVAHHLDLISAVTE